jgi:hypothetical protein
LFYDNFFKEGWIYFYKFILYILNHFEDDILAEDDLGDILLPIKSRKNTDKFERFLSKIPIIKKFAGREFWDKILVGCKKIEIDKANINQMLTNFDAERLTFKLNSK